MQGSYSGKDGKVERKCLLCRLADHFYLGEVPICDGCKDKLKDLGYIKLPTPGSKEWEKLKLKLLDILEESAGNVADGYSELDVPEFFESILTPIVYAILSLLAGVMEGER